MVLLKLDGGFLQLGHAAKLVGEPMVLVSAFDKKKIGQKEKRSPSRASQSRWSPLDFISRTISTGIFQNYDVCDHVLKDINTDIYI